MVDSVPDKGWGGVEEQLRLGDQESPERVAGFIDGRLEQLRQHLRLLRGKQRGARLLVEAVDCTWRGGTQSFQSEPSRVEQSDLA
eukprot:2375184-Prymnesium_polylepis.2